MIIQPPSLAALTWTGAAAGAVADSWRVGQVLIARPAGLDAQGQQVLKIGATSVTTSALGERLPPEFQVRVLSLGAQPVLEALIRPPAADVLKQALYARVPQQAGYAHLLADLQVLAQRRFIRHLPAGVRESLARLEQAIGQPADLVHPDRLRQAIEQSGVFLEARLLAGAPEGGEMEDWKAALLRLQASLAGAPAPRLRPANAPAAPPPLAQGGVVPQDRALAPLVLADEAQAVWDLLGQLKGDVHAALARLEVAQLEAAKAQAWMIEIPIRHADGHDVMQLRIGREPAEEATSGDPETVHPWTLGFAMAWPQAGAIQGELRLKGAQLDVRLWAEHHRTTQAIEAQFTPLRQRLASLGLTLNQLSCHTGLPQPTGPSSAVFLRATA